MNDEAAEHPEVQFIACALSLDEGNEKAVLKAIPKYVI